MTQEISRKIFPDFFQILQFRGMTQGIFRKIFPGKFHEYLPMKKYFFPKTGHDSEAFPENFSNISEIFLCHYPKFLNFQFYLLSQISKKFPKNPLSHAPKSLKLLLEKVFGKSPESLPGFLDPVSFELKYLYQVR